MDENAEKYITFNFYLLGMKSAIFQNNTSLINCDGNSWRPSQNILASSGDDKIYRWEKGFVKYWTSWNVFVCVVQFQFFSIITHTL